MGKICIFTGHRQLPSSVSPLQQALALRIEALAREGYTDFLSGGAVGFDLLAAEAVLRARERFPALRLLMILPYEGQDRFYPAADRRRYQALLERADLVRYTARDYYKGCLLTRDRVLAEAADGCVCYLTRSTGGTAYTVRHAVARDVPVWNLADDLSAR